ncbi:MAG: hypothetical protein D6748_14045 [Calditrichaeota bacterium]|nr:MAG: hypothetical protein D6748_14045 [Calditrichota bacterium]
MHGDTILDRSRGKILTKTVAQFVYGTRMNVPDYLLKDRRRHRVLADKLGSIHLVVDDLTGEVVRRIDYDPWGVVLHDTNPGFQPFGFAGGIYNVDTKKIKFGYRNYSHFTGRWMSKDTILTNLKSECLYCYSSNSPVVLFDIYGLDYLYFDGLFLSWYSNSGELIGQWSAVSGPYGRGRAPEGNYFVTIAGDVTPYTNPRNRNEFCDKLGNCWFARITPQFPTTRSGLGIHPDFDSDSGTAGCIGVTEPNTERLYNLLHNYNQDTNGPLELLIQYPR